MISSGQAGSLLPFAITVYYTMNGTQGQTFDTEKTIVKTAVFSVSNVNS
jgi:hypothetical protein